MSNWQIFFYPDVVHLIHVQDTSFFSYSRFAMLSCTFQHFLFLLRFLVLFCLSFDFGNLVPQMRFPQLVCWKRRRMGGIWTADLLVAERAHRPPTPLTFSRYYFIQIWQTWLWNILIRNKGGNKHWYQC